MKLAETIGCIISEIALFLMKCLLWAEKQIFFTFGIKLPFLNKVWKRRSLRLQLKLDREHNTNFSGLNPSNAL